MAVGLVVAGCTAGPLESSATTTAPQQRTTTTVAATTTTDAASTTTTTLSDEEIDWVAYVEEALDYAETNHYRSHELNWGTIRADTLALVLTNPSRNNAEIGMKRLNRRTGATYTPARWKDVEYAPEVRFPSNPPRGRRLAGDIGYLDLRSGWEDLDDFITNVRHLVEFIDRIPVCGWVIDLRNTELVGLARFIAALNPVLGEGTIVTYGPPYGPDEWSLHDGVLLVNGEPWETQAGEGYTVHDPDVPVALLTSATAGVSAAHFLVAFQGRPDTRSLGEPTGHAVLVSSRLDLPDGSTLEVPSGQVYDRAGTAYDSRMEPDERILMVPTDSGDAVLHAATSWIGDVAEACVQDADADTLA